VIRRPLINRSFSFPFDDLGWGSQSNFSSSYLSTFVTKIRRKKCFMNPSPGVLGRQETFPIQNLENLY
jgi:hypothetical protein